jgi:hypothetical protein
MKQSNMGCRLYFKAFTAYRFYKVKVEKNRSLTVPVVLAHPHVLEEKSVVVQHATPAIEEALVLCIKSYGDHRYIDARDICYFKRITTLQIYT